MRRIFYASLAMMFTLCLLEATSRVHGNTNIGGSLCQASPKNCGGCMLGYDPSFKSGGKTGMCVAINCPGATGTLTFMTCQAISMTGSCSQNSNSIGARACPTCSAKPCTTGGTGGCDKSKCGASTGKCSGGAVYDGKSFPSC
jgi:hypothetical protein